MSIFIDCSVIREPLLSEVVLLGIITLCVASCYVGLSCFLTAYLFVRRDLMKKTRSTIRLSVHDKLDLLYVFWCMTYETRALKGVEIYSIKLEIWHP